jgi:large subunit ribosomal protein L18
MRDRRHRRIRKRVQGTAERPRLAVRRSLRHIYAQVVDDVEAKTLVSISTMDKAARAELAALESRMERSKRLGKLLAERAKEKGVSVVTFDRGGYLYHGHIKAVADGAREGGLEF